MSTMHKSEAKTGVDRNLKALRDKAAELRRRMSAEKAAAIVSRLEDPSDSGDLSQQSHEEWLFLNRNNLEKTLLRQVEAALMRVKEGTYGICQECEEPISPKRLQALPWAKFCVRCQEMLGAMAEQD
jgi:RNA polymerase-binding transcription factor